MKGKKGQSVIIGIMVFIMVFFTVVALIEPLKDGITIARDVNHLDCTNTSISAGTKGTCIIVDWQLPYFVAVALAAGAFYITGKGLQKI